MVEGGGTVHTPVPDRRPRRRAAARRRSVLRRRLPGHALRAATAVPVEPGRRAKLAEVRQIGDVVLLRYALSRGSGRLMPRPPRDDPHPGQAPLRFSDGYATVARVFTFDGLVDGRSTRLRARRSAAAVTSPGACAMPLVRPPQRVPHRRRVRQPTMRLRRAAARGRRAHRRLRRLPVVSAAGGTRASASTPSSTPTRCRTPGSTPMRRTSRSATARTSAATSSPHRCCTRWGRRGSPCSATTPTRPAQLGRLRGDRERAGADRRAPVRRERPLPGDEGAAAARTRSTSRCSAG